MGRFNCRRVSSTKTSWFGRDISESSCEDIGDIGQGITTLDLEPGKYQFLVQLVAIFPGVAISIGAPSGYEFSSIKRYALFFGSQGPWYSGVVAKVMGICSWIGYTLKQVTMEF